MKSASGFTEPLVSDTPLPLHELCARIYDRIASLLDEKDPSPKIKNVQEQTKLALQIIEQAFDQYRLVVSLNRVYHADTFVVYQNSH